MSARSFVLIANPHAGRGHAPRMMERTAAALRAAGAAVHAEVTTSIAHATDLAKRATAAGDVVVAIGGDGVLRGVVAGAVGQGGTVGIVPCGRGNDFARSLGISAAVSGVDRCVAVLLTGVARKVDCLEIASASSDPTEVAPEIAIGNLYLGFDSLSNGLANSIRVNLGSLTYTYPAVRVALTMRPLHFRLRIDGQSTAYAGSGMVIANGGYYGRGIRVAPHADVHDGLLDVLLFQQTDRWRRLTALHALKAGRHLDRRDVQQISARRVQVQVTPALEAYSDGDPVGRTPLTATVLPGAITMLCP